jgi:hypothetical protein
VPTPEERIALQKRLYESDMPRRRLWFALRSRVLTESEMETVFSYDYQLAMEPMNSKSEEQARIEFNAALGNQFNMRLAAESQKSLLVERTETDLQTQAE